MSALRQEIEWALGDQLAKEGHIGDPQIRTMLQRLSEMLSPHYSKQQIFDFTWDLEMAFYEESARTSEAAFLIGARWAKDPMLLFMDEEREPRAGPPTRAEALAILAPRPTLARQHHSVPIVRRGGKRP